MDMLRLCVLLVAATGACLAVRTVRVKPQLDHQHKCFLDEINSLNPRNCSGLEDNTVAHGGNCSVNHVPVGGEQKAVDHRRLELDVLKCQDGHWTGTDTSLGEIKHRQKRGLLDDFGDWLCRIFCDDDDPSPKTKHPPSFSDPCKPSGVQGNYNAAAGDSSAVVSWTTPTATDSDDDAAPSVTQVGGGTNGGSFEGSVSGKTHYITYNAADSDGLIGHCRFSFTVTIRKCDTLAMPDNGGRTCDNNNILGSSCRYWCYTGYQIKGSSTVTCTNDASPDWSTIPACQKITCSAPVSPADGSLDCDDLTYAYLTICTVKCVDGYALEDQLYMQCLGNGTWSNAGSSACIDDTPPMISCHTPQVFYADRSKNSTSVKWDAPTAIDIADSNPEIVQTDGPTQGIVIEVGSVRVKYKATDSNGNESPECFIELRVEEIACGHPLDTFNDSYIRSNCLTRRYVYGTECILTCTANLPLNGTDRIVCEKNEDEGVWEWGNGTMPYCREIACPKLNPPTNGVLVYHTIWNRPVRTMMCNDKFDIADIRGFSGMFYCTNDGYWFPLKDVPNCIEPRNPANRHLGEIFYYGGDCGTEETMAQIKQNFKDIIEKRLNPFLKIICPGETCTVGNITIECGNRTINAEGNARDHDIHRRQVETHLLILDFNIIVDLILDNTTLELALQKYDEIQLNILKPAVQEFIDNGTFDIAGFELKNDSFQTRAVGDGICPPGYILDITMCKPCPIGYFLNDTVCDKCAIGQYKANEGELECTTCQTGYSTKKSGSKCPDDCIELCGPGMYSPDTMENCSVCPHGTYQDEQGQTTCKQCPAGTTTVWTKRTSVSDCTSYDVLLETTNGYVTVAPISESLDDISLMFWSKRADGQSSNTVVRLNNTNGDTVIDIHLTENVRVEIPSLVDEIVGTHSSVAWNHVAVTWDTANSIVNLYINGEKIHTITAVAPTSPLLQNGHFVVTSSGQSGVYLTDLHLLDTILTDRDIETHATSCHVTEYNDVINMGVFKQIAEQGIWLVVPSNCDAVDECSVSSSCNGHPCINGQNTYICRCTGRWSGSNCTTPPDFCVDNECTNDATCQSGLSNYTCTCSPGYSGLFCDIPPVDGGLSEWSSWSACSKSCDTGKQSRSRQCDSPVPDAYGNDCVGDLTEVMSCNTKECQVCEELKVQYGTLKNCSDDGITGSMPCTIYCVDGMIMPPGLREYQVYKCGPDTDYKWDSMDVTPSCVGPVGPRQIGITSTVEYTSSVANSAEEQLITAVNNNLQSTDCFNSEACQTSININASKRRRRSAGTTLTIMFGIPLLQGPDLQYDDYVSNGTVSGALQELVDGIMYLESTALYLQNNTSDVFDVTINGVTYTADVSSLTFVVDVTCDSGQASYKGVCLECPSGTYLVDNVCSFCEKGTYQPSTGQTSCITCSSGVTTNTIGSSAISQCSAECPSGTYLVDGVCSFCEKGTYQPSTGQTSCIKCSSGRTTTTIGSSAISQCLDTKTTRAMYIAIFTSIGAMILAVVAIAIIFWFKKLRNKAPVTGSDEWRSSMGQ